MSLPSLLHRWLCLGLLRVNLFVGYSGDEAYRTHLGFM